MPKITEKRNFELDHTLSLKVTDLASQLHDCDLDLKSNHIYLFGVDRGYDLTGSENGDEPGVDYTMANRFIKNFNLCMRKNPKKPILIHMKSCGGDWQEGMAIYDTIRSCPWPVTILNYTHARSMTSIILQAANKRVMMPHSYFMLHDGTLSVSGTYKQVKSIISFDKTKEAMLDIYVRSMKQHGELSTKTAKYIKNWIISKMDKKEDVFLSANEAVKFGLADEVFDYNWKNLIKYTPEQMER